MSVLKANKNTPNVLKRAFPDSDFDFFSASKRPHFGDATMKLTTEQLSVAEKQDLVTHVIALQEHIATLERTAKSNLAQTSAKVSSNSVHATMTPEEQAAAVQKVRNIMITGIRSQMTVRYPLSGTCLILMIVETILQNRKGKIQLYRSCPIAIRLFRSLQRPSEFQEKNHSNDPR